MKKIWSLVIGSIFLVSCSTKMNQYVKDRNHTSKRDGKWKEEYSSDEGTLIASGRYKMGEKVGTWKTTFDDKLYQKDRIKKGRIRTRRYFPNGRLMEKGQTKLDISDNERHWYYFGDWKYYNDHGQLLYIKTYNGKKIDSIPIKNR